LTVLSAGAGFGKTALIHQATAATRESADTSVDLWLGLRPAHRLRGPLVEAVRSLVSASKTSDDSEAIANAVWQRAPAEVALVLDDCHLIEPGSEAAQFLAELVEALPENGHFLLAGRREPPVPVSRLLAQGNAVVVDEADLAFDSAELQTFARLRGIDASALTETGGWPAVLELRADIGEPRVVEFLWDEVVSRIGEERGRALARLSCLTEFDDGLVRDLTALNTSALDLVAGLPLTATTETGAVRLHPLWRPVLSRFSEASDTDTRRQAVRALCGRNDAMRAADLCLEVEDPAVLDALVDELVPTHAAQLPEDVVGEFIARLPGTALDRPSGRFLQGTAALSTDPDRAELLLERATDGFAGAGDVPAALLSLGPRMRSAFWRADNSAIAALIQKVEELAANESEPPPLALLGRATAVLAAGLPEAALARVDEARRSNRDAGIESYFDLIAMLACMDTGNPERALDEASTLRNRPEQQAQSNANAVGSEARWLLGKISVAELDRLAGRLEANAGGIHQNLAMNHASMSHMYASVGQLEAARSQLELAAPSLARSVGPRPAMVAAVSRAATEVLNDDEAAASDTLRDQLATSPLGERPRRMVLRGTGFFYVLLPETRPVFDAYEMGPVFAQLRETARALVALRETGETGPAAGLDWSDPRRLGAMLVPNWTIELAVAAFAAGNLAAKDALEFAAIDPRPVLRGLRKARAKRVSRAARDLLLTLPLPPRHRIEIRVLGSAELLRDDIPVADRSWRRERVRSLLNFLVERRRCSRGAAGLALWPDHDEESVRNNLRVTLNYLQGILEPDRDAGEPGWFLRTDGSQLSLAEVEELTIDVDQFERHADAAEQAEARGDPQATLDHYLAAISIYRGDYLEDAANEEWGDLERTRLRSRFIRGAVRGGELLIAHGEARRAIEILRRAIEIDPYAEAAHRAAALAFCSLGDRSAARKAVEACLRQLAELGVDPDLETQALAAELGLRDSG
jgi:DNA-binding SARP family transcriptional activator